MRHILLATVFLLIFAARSEARKSPGFHFTHSYTRKDGTHVSSYYSGSGPTLSRSYGGRGYGSYSNSGGDDLDNSWLQQRNSEANSVMQQAQDAWNGLAGYSAMPLDNGKSPSLEAQDYLDDLARKEASKEKASKEAQDKIRTQSFYGLCSSVVDGDTLKVNRNGIAETIHLFGIEAPEIGQPHGEDVRNMVKKWLLSQYVYVYPSTINEDGSLVGAIVFEKQSVTMELVKCGLVWCQGRGVADGNPFTVTEARAKLARIGLWADSTSISPWEWRTSHPKKE